MEIGIISIQKTQWNKFYHLQIATDGRDHLYPFSNIIVTVLWTSQLWCSQFSYETIEHSQARPISHHFLIPTTHPSPFEIFESTESWDRYRGNVCEVTGGAAVTYGFQNLRQSQI